MPYKCVAYGCGKISGQNVSMFRFPKDPEEFRKWQRQVQKTRRNWLGNTYSHLCNEHFTRDCFETKSYATAKASGFKRLKLKDGAVPTVFIRRRCRKCGGKGVSCSFCKKKHEASTQPQQFASVSIFFHTRLFQTRSGKNLKNLRVLWIMILEFVMI